ncbi:hypothetical protein BX600DRAFT_482039 [Xylariales sp. PMI_506]|nr:hypothetical protein BX600DRAFT_482039 [Xylariales sp. PMI_506]
MSQNLLSAAKKEGGIAAFFHRQFWLHPPSLPEGTDLSDRVAIITGGNGGLGFEASRQLLRLRPNQLIITVRSQSKGDEATEKLRREFPDSSVSAWILDMESYDSITAFAKKCESLPRIDVVILNAGIQEYVYTLNPNTKHEQTLQINYLSTALLTILLLPVLKSKKHPDSKPPVLSIVTSDTAYWANVTTTGPILTELDKEENFGNDTYARSKLLLFWFAQKLAGLVSSDDVVINLTNPGLTAGTSLNDSTLSKLNPLLSVVASTAKGLVARSTEDGANNYIYATVVQGKESHGSYVSDWKIQPYPLIVYGEDGNKVRERLWEETMQELDFANAAGIVQGMAT